MTETAATTHYTAVEILDMAASCIKAIKQLNDSLAESARKSTMRVDNPAEDILTFNTSIFPTEDLLALPFVRAGKDKKELTLQLGPDSVPEWVDLLSAGRFHRFSFFAHSPNRWTDDCGDDETYEIKEINDEFTPVYTDLRFQDLTPESVISKALCRDGRFAVTKIVF